MSIEPSSPHCTLAQKCAVAQLFSDSSAYYSQQNTTQFAGRGSDFQPDVPMTTPKRAVTEIVFGRVDASFIQSNRNLSEGRGVYAKNR
jgi:hypothetical protein